MDLEVAIRDLVGEDLEVDVATRGSVEGEIPALAEGVVVREEAVLAVAGKGSHKHSKSTVE